MTGVAAGAFAIHEGEQGERMHADAANLQIEGFSPVAAKLEKQSDRLRAISDATSVVEALALLAGAAIIIIPVMQARTAELGVSQTPQPPTPPVGPTDAPH